MRSFFEDKYTNAELYRWMRGELATLHYQAYRLAFDMARRAGLPADASDALIASGVDFVLEGLYSQKKISRTEGRGFHAAEARRPQPQERRAPVLAPDDDLEPGESGRKKKRYYN